MALSQTLSKKLARNPGARSALPSALRNNLRLSRTSVRKSPVFATQKVEQEDVTGVISGEWSPAWSLASYEDLNNFYANQMFKDTKLPSSMLKDVMQKDVKTVTADMSLDSIKPLLSRFSGCPVVDKEQKLIGIISRKDVEAKTGVYVSEVMSTPPIAAPPTAKVADAAALMIKYKMSRIPVVDQNSKVVGLISKTDIFQPLK